MNPENTLLGLLTGGRYMQSSDLPTARQVGSSAIDKIIESDNKRRGKVLFESGKNIFGKPTEEFTQGDLEDLIMGGVAGTTKPIMSKLGLSEKVPRNPLYHITNIKNIKSILDKGILPMGGRVSFTRDPDLKQVYGLGEKKLQLMLDKDLVEKFSGKKLSPFSFKTKNPKAISRTYEAEERLLSEYGGAPISSIKAIRVRDNSTKFDEKKYPWQKELNDFKTIVETNAYKTLLTSASKRNIPLIIDKNEKSFSSF